MNEESTELKTVRQYSEWSDMALNLLDLVVLMFVIVRAEEIGPLVTGFALISLIGARLYNHTGTLLAYIAVEVYRAQPKSPTTIILISLGFYALVMAQIYFKVRYTELQLKTEIEKLSGEAKQMADHIRNGFDYYQILKINPEASDSEIKKAVEKRLLELNPDGEKKCADAKENTDRYDILLFARLFLTDPLKRKQYDAIRSRYFTVVPPLKPISEKCTW